MRNKEIRGTGQETSSTESGFFRLRSSSINLQGNIGPEAHYFGRDAFGKMVGVLSSRLRQDQAFSVVLQKVVDFADPSKDSFADQMRFGCNASPEILSETLVGNWVSLAAEKALLDAKPSLGEKEGARWIQLEGDVARLEDAISLAHSGDKSIEFGADIVRILVDPFGDTQKAILFAIDDAVDGLANSTARGVHKVAPYAILGALIIEGCGNFPFTRPINTLPPPRVNVTHIAPSPTLMAEVKPMVTSTEIAPILSSTSTPEYRAPVVPPNNPPEFKAEGGAFPESIQIKANEDKHRALLVLARQKGITILATTDEEAFQKLDEVARKQGWKVVQSWNNKFDNDYQLVSMVTDSTGVYWFVTSLGAFSTRPDAPSTDDSTLQHIPVKPGEKVALEWGDDGNVYLYGYTSPNGIPTEQEWFNTTTAVYDGGEVVKGGWEKRVVTATAETGPKVGDVTIMENYYDLGKAEITTKRVDQLSEQEIEDLMARPSLKACTLNIESRGNHGYYQRAYFDNANLLGKELRVIKLDKSLTIPVGRKDYTITGGTEIVMKWGCKKNDGTFNILYVTIRGSLATEGDAINRPLDIAYDSSSLELGNSINATFNFVQPDSETNGGRFMEDIQSNESKNHYNLSTADIFGFIGWGGGDNKITREDVLKAFNTNTLTIDSAILKSGSLIGR